jgi:hypothetical protein
MDFQAIGRILLVVGISIIIVGLLLMLVGRSGFLTNLPATLHFEFPGGSCLVPIGLSILLSIILTIVLNIVIRLINRP